LTITFDCELEDERPNEKDGKEGYDQDLDGGGVELGTLLESAIVGVEAL